MDRPKPRWIPASSQPWLSNRWVKAVLVVAVFALIGGIFMLTTDRKDAGFWNGYTDGQRWVDAGGYKAHKESIATYCADQAANKSASYKRGCIDGATNAMDDMKTLR
ncbi:hypothetical protein [Mycolicibacterium sp. P1-5]|uniref:hypothetical protein n=1 Tax=Mycolicibacterium sp. P1-5 TaxID=2024617 RepID=UPI0011ECEE96|nr:hypothetical protein [Mycolicibacterium sp. P1-5]KAA0111971.1 hypothetical protein CIW47_01580 [Mycolicibacterium sp. P1-5]